MFYLDTSVAIHALEVTPLGQATRRWLSGESLQGNRFASSRLLQTEIVRTLRRDNLDPAGAQQVVKDVWLVPLSDDIAVRAEEIRPHIRTLAALHLATALTIGSSIIVATHDARMRGVAELLGLSTFDPLTDTA
ncbi:MAG: PIN domain-containing protein [Promicromonosporaceae bacterium]|nr:PIN domain-containing protein [Promicromonosporaceae bacterium]